MVKDSDKENETVKNGAGRKVPDAASSVMGKESGPTELLPADTKSGDGSLKTMDTGESIFEEPTKYIDSESTLLQATVQIIDGRAVSEPAALHEAEAKVPVEWNKGDVILDLYEVTDIFSEGGTATVYKVYHRAWNMELAVKSPKPDVLRAAVGAENFEREAETWVNLGLHPHIVSCYYVRRLGGIPRLFAEYVNGGDLSDWVHKRTLYEGGPDKAMERILDVAMQFAWGLQYAHEQGLIHQDVKPANVMMNRDGTAKVTDFGMAKALPVVDEIPLDGSNRNILVSCGGMTPEYCSPEQAEIIRQAKQGIPHARRGKLTRLTDIWSWAVSMLEMFTGGVTWESGRVADSVLESYLKTGPEDSFIPKMPAGMAELLSQCLRQNVDERPQSMGDVFAVLQDIYREETGHEYLRPTPRPAEALAGSLNNRAVSLLDLWRQAEAEECWEKAMRVHPHHPESTYNRGLRLWRSGRLNDDALIREMEEVRQSHKADWKNDYLLGLVNLERGDYEGAGRVLGNIAEEDISYKEVQDSISAAKQNVSHSRKLLNTFEGHNNAVNSVCLSTDGLYGVSGSGSQFAFVKEKDFTIRIWALQEGNCLRTFKGHTGRVTSVCLNRDGSHVLSGSVDMTVKLWEFGTGRCIRTFEGHTSVVESVCLTHDTSYALSGSRDTTLKLWEVDTGGCLHTFEGHSDKVTSICFTPDEQYVLSGSGDMSLRLWETGTGHCLRTFKGHTAGVVSVCLSQDGRFALSGSEDTTLRLWETGTGHCLRTFKGHSETVSSVCMSYDGHYMLSGGGGFLGKEWLVKIWEKGTGRCLHTFEGHKGTVTSVCFTRDGQYALSGSEDMTLKLWKVDLDAKPYRAPMSLSRMQGSEEIVSAQLEYEKEMAGARAALDRNDAVEAAGHIRKARSQKGYSRTQDAIDAWAELYVRLPKNAFREGWVESTFKGHTDSVCSVCVSRDGRHSVSGSEDAALRMWEVKTGRCLQTFEGHSGSVLSVCMSKDKKYILSGSGDAAIKLWMADTGQCLRTFKGHLESVFSISLTQDGRFALSGSEDSTLKLWEVETGRCLRTFEGHAGRVASVCLSRDGRYALSGSDDRSIRLWETATGRCLRTFEGRSYSVTSVCLSPDSRFALSGSKDSTLKLWEVETGRCLRTFEGHAGRVASVCLSRDGRYALSGSDDRSIRLWEAATGRCLRTFEGHSYSVNSVCLSRDGRFALSGSRDETIKLWMLDWELESRETSDWDEGAGFCLETFLTVHMPYDSMLPHDHKPSDEETVKALTRRGKPTWSDNDFEELIYTLGCSGYGRLSHEGVQKKLEEMAASWQGPTPIVKAFHMDTGKTDKKEPEKKSDKKKRSTLLLDTD